MSHARPAFDPLSVFATVARAVTDDGDLDDALGTLLGATGDALGIRSGAIYVQDPDRVGLVPLLAVGIDEADMDALAVDDAGADPLLDVAREHRRVAATGDATGAFGRAGGNGTATFQPLVTSRGGIDLPVGVLALGWAGERGLTPDEETLLEAVADLAAVAIDRSRLATLVAERAEWFERVAHSDPLTGLANQRTFARVLELELARAGRQGGEVSVAVVDVDGFRATNEEAGRDVGDDVLRTVASVLAESVRLVDTVARAGGDEFVIVAPGSAGLTVARRIQSAVENLPAVGPDATSVSIGVARFPVDGTSADELLAAAHAALEAARSGGRGSIGESTVQPAT